ncbi:12571_t:CDS:2 [Ambispora leptoticha]|uniref:12571_t:CDS:1 n=1 Tax=Ambispora leptoticha TaxID=144679 RepID=A0A9N8ZUS0_9GLOM|nr:12571_t:CDS:2 [Ambispora leptoticha]
MLQTKIYIYLKEIFHRYRHIEPKSIVVCRGISALLILALLTTFTAFLIIDILDDGPVLQKTTFEVDSLPIPATDENCTEYVSQSVQTINEEWMTILLGALALFSGIWVIAAGVYTCLLGTTVLRPWGLIHSCCFPNDNRKHIRNRFLIIPLFSPAVNGNSPVVNNFGTDDEFKTRVEERFNTLEDFLKDYVVNAGYLEEFVKNANNDNQLLNDMISISLANVISNSVRINNDLSNINRSIIISEVINSVLPIEYPPTSHQGVAILFNVKDWAKTNAAFDDAKFIFAIENHYPYKKFDGQYCNGLPTIQRLRTKAQSVNNNQDVPLLPSFLLDINTVYWRKNYYFLKVEDNINIELLQNLLDGNFETSLKKSYITDKDDIELSEYQIALELNLKKQEIEIRALVFNILFKEKKLQDHKE